MIEGGNHVAMAKTACLTALEFTNGLHSLDPDIVVICGDRFEQLAIAMAAAYLNMTIAHIEGGDVTGSIDESVRHAITKLSHLHFVTNDEAHRRVLAMGEDPRFVFNTGSLDVELASRVTKALTTHEINAYGVGHSVDIAKPFLMVIQHPVTTERDNRAHIETTMNAIAALGMPAIWFWLEPYLALVEQLSEEAGVDMAEIAAAATRLATGDRPLHATLEPEPPTAPADGGMVRLFLDAGRQAGVRPADIVGAVAGEADIPGHAIGAIDIYERFAFVEVPAAYAERVLERMQHVKIRNRPVKAKPATPPAGDAPSSRSPARRPSRCAAPSPRRRGGRGSGARSAGRRA